MRKLRQFSMVVVFTLVLATGASAGIIQTGATSPAPPDPAAATGIIHTGSPSSSGQETLTPPSDEFAGVALNLLQSLLLVF